MKYRYPMQKVWPNALLLAVCLSLTLISTIAWLLLAASAETPDASAATTESVIPALLMMGSWIGSALLAGRLSLRPFMIFSLVFWGAELVLYLICLIPPIFDSAQALFSLLTLPMWSYFALIALFDVQNVAANAVMTVLPTLILLAVFARQLMRRK